MVAGLQARLVLYGILLALALGALFYVKHLKNAWLDEHDAALMANQAAAGHQAVIGVMQAHSARQEAASHAKDQELQRLARSYANFRAGVEAERKRDPVYDGWAATRHPDAVARLLSHPDGAGSRPPGGPPTVGGTSATDGAP